MLIILAPLKKMKENLSKLQTNDKHLYCLTVI